MAFGLGGCLDWLVVVVYCFTCDYLLVVGILVVGLVAAVGGLFDCGCFMLTISCCGFNSVVLDTLCLFV